jgi:sulfatase modifying factor 1
MKHLTMVSAITGLCSMFVVMVSCDECERTTDCDPGEICLDGTCEQVEPFSPDSDSDSDSDIDADSDTDTDDPYGLDWIEILGGSYMMGGDEMTAAETPVHQVTIATFEMTRSEVTAYQYSKCFNEGTCSAPEIGSRMTWGVAAKAHHPANGVTWFQANDFCLWAGGRMPSESEWEYAARSGGMDLKYPWGDADPTCDYCIIDEEEGSQGCGTGGTEVVCSVPAGDTEEGLCDMAGSVYEWTMDTWHPTYDGAPADGSAWIDGTEANWAIRSGSYREGPDVLLLQTRGRLGYDTSEPDLGFRCARGGGSTDPDAGPDDGGASFD